MEYLVRLLIIATIAKYTCGTMDYSKVKLKTQPQKFLDRYSKLQPNTNERYTGCMCPPSLNTKGSFYGLCGHELKPKVGGTCVEEGGYRCTDGHAEAILVFDCPDESIRQGKKLRCADNESCEPECKLQKTKACLPLVKYKI